jgi:hypothetical protein
MAGPEPHNVRWVDVRTAHAMTGVPISCLAWAMADGEVRYTTGLPGHEHTPMVALEDVQGLSEAPSPAFLQAAAATET